MLNVIARIDVLPGRMEEFLRIFKANVPNVLAEDGCLRYEPCVDFSCGLYSGDSNAVTVLETWQSLEHLEKHLASPHMKAYAEAVKDLRSGMKLTLVEKA